MVTMHYSFLNEDAGQNENTKIIKTIKLFRIIYPIVTLITISLYFLAAFTNPGYIIGNTRLPKPKWIINIISLYQVSRLVSILWTTGCPDTLFRE